MKSGCGGLGFLSIWVDLVKYWHFGCLKCNSLSSTSRRNTDVLPAGQETTNGSALTKNGGEWLKCFEVVKETTHPRICLELEPVPVAWPLLLLPRQYIPGCGWKVSSLICGCSCQCISCVLLICQLCFPWLVPSAHIRSQILILVNVHWSLQLGQPWEWIKGGCWEVRKWCSPPWSEEGTTPGAIWVFSPWRQQILLQ